MIGLSRSPESSRLMSETDREDSPPPAPDVTADPRAPKCQSVPSSTSDRSGGNSSSTNGSVVNAMTLFNGPPLTGIRNNEVRTVMLYGVPIVALVIDGYERLCLAQISNTLLKTFSYNEIHNRRVALGITCVQCTPVQLELLRRAGAMPVSSRRCGLITKREAERLCKSFLAETRPPKLPDNFAFEVVHNCAWGCRGSFVPSRYNSSRAKCIKCAYCCLFFSPNKFIFHSHRLPDSKYVQPDAANFNSWRRHIKLGGTPPDEVVYAWEDVKAMFNGGSRKRILSGCSPSRSGEHKRSRISPASNPDSTPCNSDSSHHTAKATPYFPVVPLPNKSFSLQPGPAFVSPAGPPFGLAAAAAAATGKAISPVDIRQSFAEYMWAGKQPFPLPYGGMLWPRPAAAGLVPQSGPATSLDIRDNRNHTQEKSALPPYSLADTTTSLLDPGRPLSSASEGTTRSFPDPADDDAVSPGRLSPSTVPASTAHASAFRPVGHRLLLRSATAIAASATASAAMPHTSESTVDTTSDHRTNTYLTSSSAYACYAMTDGRCRDGEEDGGSVSSDHDEVDVTDVSNDGLATTKEGVTTSAGNGDDRRISPTSMDDRSGSPPDLTPATPDTSEPYVKKGTRKQEKNEDDTTANHIVDSVSGNHLLFRPVLDKVDPLNMTSNSMPFKGGRPFESVLMDEERLSSLSKEELKEVLLQEAEARRRAEREYQVIRDTFEEQVRKEIAYREEVAKQLQIVREAHDALHHFSCKMLASRHCAECGYKPSMPE